MLCTQNPWNQLDLLGIYDYYDESRRINGKFKKVIDIFREYRTLFKKYKQTFLIEPEDIGYKIRSFINIGVNILPIELDS